MELAESANRRAYPKPTVGAVVVADGEVVGEGATEESGRHGEIVALEAAGELARGATLFVTMEPCAHHGTTPPCVDAVLAAGVSRVVAGLARPEPRGAGRARAAPGERRRGRARRQLRGAAPERGVANLGRARPAVRHLQGGDDARRAGHRAGRALGLRGGIAPPRPRAARRVRRGRRRHGNRASRESAPRRARRRREAPAAAAGLRHRPAAGGLRARAALRPARGRAAARSPPRASSRCCSREARRWPGRSWRRGLVDKLLLFVAPVLSGAGPGLLESLERAGPAHALVEPAGRARTFSSRRTSASRNL